MFPATCQTCGLAIRSKTQHTHHRRLCRGGVIARIAAVVEMPAGLEVSAGPPGGRVLVRRLTGLPPGKHFVVSHEQGGTVKTLTSHETAAQAADEFLTRRDSLGLP